MNIQMTGRSTWGQIFMSFGDFAAESWFLMLMLGVIHGYAHAVPALSYGVCCLLWLLIPQSLSHIPANNFVNTKRKP